MRRLLPLVVIILFSISAYSQEVSKIPITDSLKDSQSQSPASGGGDFGGGGAGGSWSVEKQIENNLADRLREHALDVYSQRVLFGSSAPSGTCPTGKIYERTSNGYIYGCAAGTWTLVASGSSISGLTTNTIPKAASSTTIGDSSITESAGVVTVTSESFGLSGNISGAGIFSTSGIRYKNVPGTLTDTTSTGTVATNYTNVFGANTLAASSATTITNDFNTYFKDPIAGTNVTLTNKWALGADSVKIGTSNQFSVGNAGHVTVEGVTSTGATGTGNFMFSVSPTASGTFAAAAVTASGAVTQTSNSATAFESGANGGTNPVLRLVNSTTSQADGISITGLAAGNGTNITALSSGATSPLILQVRSGSAPVTSMTLGSDKSVTFAAGASVSSAGSFISTNGGVSSSYLASTGVFLPSGAGVKWSSGSDGTASVDTALSRDAAGVIDFGTGAAGSTAGSLKATNVTLTGTISTSSTTDSTTTTSGALQVAGGAAIRKRVFIDGITVSSGLQTAVLCQSSGGEMIADSVACLASSARFKNRIKPLSSGLNEILSLRPVSFYYKPEGIFAANQNFQRERVGLIAEDVAKIDPRLVGFENDGMTPRTVGYEQIVPVLIKAVQEQQKQIEGLKQQIAEMKRPLVRRRARRAR